jgi:hypothetical protein
MLESMHGFLQSIREVFDNDKTSLDVKIETLVSNYIDLFIKNPEIPLFLLSELKTHPDDFVQKLGIKDIIMNSYFLKQFQQQIKEGKIVPLNPLHFMMNMMGMTLLPFIAKPIINSLGDLSHKSFNDMMQERKILIPKWIKATLKTK